MSRPTTRGKNKRPLQATESDAIPEILRKINVTGEVSEDALNKLYMVYKPVCQGCRVNSKDNPNCFCGLIPPPNGSRKTGLWQKTSEFVQALGPDPSENLRASANSPAGLTNLGATCYANSIIQCLYMNKSFREGLFCVEPEVLKGNPVLDQLARLFAQLHASKRAFIDSAPFIKTLELDNGVQQDSHEFLTLLLSLLERSLSHSSVAKARTVVQDLFRGSVSHVTTCSQCGQNSEASSKMEDFYELELNVKGLKTLDDSLDDCLSVEELQGDNQYFCESCNGRVDATRSIKLQTLPNVLNFQLKRYDFLPKTTTRKKISSAFSFPRELDMQWRLSEQSQMELTYDLAAVLIHKGTAANSGHYIAHIKDVNTGQWWKFDDEDVSYLGHHPFGDGTSTSTVKAAGTEKFVCSSRKEGTHASVNGYNLNVVQAQNAEFCVGGHVKMFSSTDAYLLTYTRRIGKDPFGGVRTMETESDDVVTHSALCLPPHLAEELEDLNSSYSDACEKFKLEKAEHLDHIMSRRQEVRSILSEALVQSAEELYCWISIDWLRQWADAISPPVLDNTPIQCPHGRVSFFKIGSMKRVSTEAWAKLISKYHGGPRLTKDDHCIDCVTSAALSLVSADSYRDRRTLMKEIAENVLSGKCQDGTYYVSKSWLQQWVKRKNLDAPSEADTGPTMSIRCPHGYLRPEQATGAKRLLVPEDLWLFFYEDSVTVKPDDPCSTFPSDSEECPECGCLEDSRRAVKLKQRQNHEKLAMGKNTPLFLNCKYYLVPSSWITKWRSYVTASGKNSSSIPEPEKLGAVISSLKCEKHSRLTERPPDVVQKRGLYFQKVPTMDRLAIVSEDDWKCFCEEWDGAGEEGISAVIELRNDGIGNLVGTCENMPVCDEHLDTSNEVDDEFQSRLPVIRTSLEVCEECIGEKESCELMQKLNYSNEDIYVYLVRGKEAPKFVLEAADSSDPDRRTSKRSRRSNHGNLISLRVSASTSVYQLKMMIWESLGVVKENQILHKGSRVIDQESATLADMNIFAGDKLWVKDSEIHEERDIADEISNQKMNIGDAEEGFRGTLLAANVSSQVV